MKPHKKHAEVIRAWLDGKQVQYHNGVDRWFDDDDPAFEEYVDYRVKPAEPDCSYPMTKMDPYELNEIWRAGPNKAALCCVDVANAALRHACDNGQIVTREEFDRAVGDRAKRDMAIARAVNMSVVVARGPLGETSLVQIIREVTK